ncbi:CAP domain-containing protein [Streptomyces sp. ODS28]|uniref:CAP domain-containing protein n=1 Tax=Streptomyces sp. ODS28 TaxID=3136688 RepID=UPI0031E52044
MTAAPVETAGAADAGDGRTHDHGSHGGHRSHRGGRAKGSRGAAPARTGLLGASAAMAMGAVAVASGLIPGVGGGFGLAPGEGSGPVRADGPEGPAGAQGAPASLSPTPEGRGGAQEPSRDQRRTDMPEHSASRGAERPSGGPSSAKPSHSSPPASRGGGSAHEGGGRGNDRQGGGSSSPGSEAGSGSSSSDGSGQNGTRSAEHEVLKLVNEERADAGCPRVRADSRLAGLAEDFSEDMAVRGFFDHVSPDGDNPWQRAEKAGIKDLGGENIARGQADARSVMDSWMSSPGHKANILNCEYRTLGVGTHYGAGGPWWTQEFGF